MKAFTAAERALLAVLAGALIVAAPALAGDSGYLGVQLQDLTPAMAKALQLGDQDGVLVSDVVDDGPAQKAGLQDGDVIVAFAGKPLSDYSSLAAAVRAAKPGDRVDVAVLRDGKRQTVTVELGEAQDDFAWNVMTGDDGEFAFKTQTLQRGWLGVHIDDLGDQLGEYFGVKDGRGALVTGVEADSPAAKAGLKAGDVIVRAGDKDVTDAADLHQALAGTKPQDQVGIEFVRKGKTQSANATLAEAPAGTLPDMTFFGDDGEFHVMAPKMMHRHLQPMGKHDVRVMRAPRGHVEVITGMADAEQDMKVMREELDQLRKELDQLRQDLKK